MKKDFKKDLFLLCTIGGIALATTACNTSGNMVIVENVSSNFYENQEKLAKNRNEENKTLRYVIDAQETLTIANGSVDVARADAKRPVIYNTGFWGRMWGGMRSIFGYEPYPAPAPRVSSATPLPVTPGPQVNANFNFGKGGNSANVSVGNGSNSGNSGNGGAVVRTNGSKADPRTMNATLGNTIGHGEGGVYDATCYPRVISTEPTGVEMLQQDNIDINGNSYSIQKKYNHLYSIVGKEFTR